VAQPAKAMHTRMAADQGSPDFSSRIAILLMGTLHHRLTLASLFMLGRSLA
jgi:hypothetical protein